MKFMKIAPLMFALLASFGSASAMAANPAQPDNGNPCWCECDTPDGQIFETQKEFNGPGRYEECAQECTKQKPGSKSVCAV